MKKIKFIFLAVVFVFLLSSFSCKLNVCHAADTSVNYYTVYSDSEKTKVLFLKGEDVSDGDFYLSHDNKLYEITNVDDDNKTAIANFVKDEELPKFNISRKTNNDNKQEENKESQASNYGQTEIASAGILDFLKNSASATVTKKVGLYHTHNDESYFDPDGTDSVYGEGGIHDVGAALNENLNKLGIETIYRTDLHLPHNSGAYTRSQVTAQAILDEGVDGIFDIHRDSTSREYYLAEVDGEEMSSIRMVVGSSSANYEENKDFAYTIKAYADEVYPNLIKDIYFGKGNYNQQLSNRAMLFEMGCENIEKDLVIKSTGYLAKVIDVVLYGSENASELSLSDVSLDSVDGEESVITGLVSSNGGSTANSNETLYVVLGVIGAVIIGFGLVMIFSKKARYKVGRFFSEMFAGIFGKKKAK